MKKTLKAIVAAMLAAIMAFGSLSAFAAETHEELEWDYYGNTYYYDYAGELKEGTNAVGESLANHEYAYLTMNIETEGYYAISYNHNNLDAWAGIPEKIENGIAYDETLCIDSYYSEDTNKTSLLYFLEAGENIFAFDIYSVNESSVIDFEFLGEEVASVSIPEEVIVDCDFFYWESDNNQPEFYLHSDVIITFDTDKTFLLDYIDGTFDEITVNAENVLRFNLADKELSVTTTIRKIDYYISDVTISSTDVKIYYDGYGYEPLENETLTVHFTDGSSKNIILSDGDLSDNHAIVLPNGSKKWIWTSYYNEYSSDVKVDIYISDAFVKTIDCNEIEASFDENIAHMKENINQNLHYAKYYFDLSVSILKDFENLGDDGALDAGFYMGLAFRDFFDASTEIFDLISYYLF